MAADGKSVILFAVNDQREAIERPLDFSAFGRDGQTLEVWTLADTRDAGEPDATNSFGGWQRSTDCMCRAFTTWPITRMARCAA